VISPRILPRIEQTGAFPVIDAYVSLAKQGAQIFGFPADGYEWRDVGTPESLEAANRDRNRHS
jgi:NDP-sugar pyrophosphorylase family protein